ncbi:transposase [Domibacillus robiginosus]|uniref:transposase n=1 Tax=Domibacillus robiginosus TaxID=1071054 RepID=UPI000A5A86EA|nr:transposase [Domibacillus robiginosus]
MSEYNRNRHARYKLTYHLVVVTKYRKKCISESIMKRLREITDWSVYTYLNRKIKVTYT